MAKLPDEKPMMAKVGPRRGAATSTSDAAARPTNCVIGFNSISVFIGKPWIPSGMIDSG